MIKLIKILFTLIVMIILSIGFILRIDHLKHYVLLIPSFMMYIFIPLVVVLNLIIKYNK